MKALIHGFRHYADFKSRDSRAVFWKFIISTHLILILLLAPTIYSLLHIFQDILQDEGFINAAIVPASIGTQIDAAELANIIRPIVESSIAELGAIFTISRIGLFMAMLWALAILLPTYSAITRRLRDAGQSPWWVLPTVISIVPVISFISGVAALLSLATLVLCLLPSVPQEQEPEQKPV